MHWISRLYETYNNCIAEAGNIVAGKLPLLPMCHSVQNSHIEITITATGDFISARPVGKKEAIIIFPVTEASVGRTGTKIAPHPLNDQLKYIAGDISVYLDGVKGADKRFDAYLSLLKDWVAFDSTNKKLKAILAFISKRTLMKELIDSNLFLLDENGKVLDKIDKTKKIKNIPAIYRSAGSIQNAFCRFCVECPGEPEIKTFMDVELFDSWCNYCNFKSPKVDLCYASGKYLPVAVSHAKGLRNTGDMAKIISGNDTTNFTYRGLCHTADHACVVSQEVSDKAHAALKWLISRQAFVHDTLVVLVWSSGGIILPDLINTSVMDTETVDTAQAYALKVNKSLAGYKQDLRIYDDINVICLDSATQGRMAVIYYREYGSEDFIRMLNRWYLSCFWLFRCRSDKGVYYNKICTPTLMQIIQTAYGPNVDTSFTNFTIRRILPCILEGAAFPADVMLQAVNRVTNRMSFEKYEDGRNEWNKALSVACALYRLCNEKEGYGMVLDENRTTRDYLYGRLLAVAENIEEWALKETGETRPTAACKYFTQFANNPYKTWGIIYTQLQPYLAKLGPKVNSRKRIIDKIMRKIDTEDFLSPRKLSAEFLLGYHNQRYEFYADKNNTDEENEDE